MRLGGLARFGLAAVVAVGMATACSSSDERDTSTASSPGGVFPVTIDHVYGSTMITQKPERVVALGVSDADVLLALGVIPIANTGYQFYESGLGPGTVDAIGDATLSHLDSDSEPNLEQIATLAPDLIVGVTAAFDSNTFTRLSMIAPTVARPSGTAEYAVGWGEQTEFIATVLGERDRGVSLDREIDEVLEAVVAANPSFAGRTGVAVLPFDGRYAVYGPREGRGQFLTSLGFSIPEAITEQDDGVSFFVPVSAENIRMFDGDLILVLGPEETYDAVAENPVMASLNAAQHGAIIATTLDERGAISFNSVLSIPWALNSIVPRITQALQSWTTGARPRSAVSTTIRALASETTTSPVVPIDRMSVAVATLPGVWASEEVAKTLDWGISVERFAGSVVELLGDEFEVFGTADAQFVPFGSTGAAGN